MAPVVPILACYALGLALLLARGGGRDPLLSAALALPIGATVSALLAFALAAGAPFLPLGYGLAWATLLALGAWGARRELRRLWPGPAAVAAVHALAALAAARFDVTVLNGRSHDALLVARLLAGTGEIPPGAPEAGGLATALYAAMSLVSPERPHVLAPVLALSGLVCLAVSAARAAPHPRRQVIGLAAALALATCFPLLRSLLTVGSPAAAGVFLLAAGGLWIACERWGDARPLPLAVAALAAFALDGAAAALAAAACLAALAIGTRLSRRGLAWRSPAAQAHPALRLAVAAALAFLAGVATGAAAAGALAAAPLALLAAVALATGGNPTFDAGERAPGSVPPEPLAPEPLAPEPLAPEPLAPGSLPPLGPLVTRADLGPLVLSWVACAAVAAALEWAVLVAERPDGVTGAGQVVRLLPLGFGNLLPYGLVASAFVLAARAVARRLGARARRPARVVAAGAALLALPYAAWLGHFAFSGPQAREMAFRPHLIALTAALIAAGFAALAGFAAVRDTWRRWPGLVAVGAALGAGAALALNRSFLENEYEPLHQLLGVWSLLLAALAGRELSALAGRRLHRPRLAPALAAAAGVWAAASGVILARAHEDAWLLWADTGASRYVTRRWSFLTPAPDLAALGGEMVVKPDLETSQTAALRARRASAPAPNIILFSIDGLRVDRVGAYGSGRHLTPTLDRFAARGVRFTRAFSSFPATQAFNTSLLFGRYVRRSLQAQQPPGFRDLAITALLKRRDYHIFVKGWFEHTLKARLDPRLYHFDTYPPKTTTTRRLERPMEESLRFLGAHLDEARRRGLPSFVWMHLLATHPVKKEGFVPHPDFRFGDSRMARYDSAVAGSDVWLRAVEEMTAARLDPTRPTIWILFADHGVHTQTYGRDLHEGVVRVPLVIVVPGAAPRVDERLVDVSLDLAATVLDLAGIAPPPEYDGVSLVPLLSGLPAGAMDARLIPLSFDRDAAGAVHGRFKYLRRGDVLSLYDLAVDPSEEHNLIGQDYDRAYRMRAVADEELEQRQRRADAARREGP